MNSLKDFEKQVKTLIAGENWAEAYKICNQILGYDPENITFLKLKLHIEKEVKLINQRSIHAEIAKLEPLLKNKQYEDYLRQIAPLQTYVKDFPEIGDKIVQAKKLMDQDFQDRKDEALAEVVKEIKVKGDQLDFDLTLQKLDQLYKLNVNPGEVLNLQKKVKRNWIALQIKQNQGLLSSQKFEDMIIFLLKLKKVDPENTQIESLIKKVKTEYQVQKVENKKDFIFKTSEEIKTLFITQKYDKCIELSQRILDIDPKNLLAINYLKKAKIKADRQSQRFITSQILENFEKFPSTKYFQDGDYIKI